MEYVNLDVNYIHDDKKDEDNYMKLDQLVGKEGKRKMKDSLASGVGKNDDWNYAFVLRFQRGIAPVV